MINYFAKHATTCEPRSQSLKELYKNSLKSIRDDDRSLKLVKKTVGEHCGWAKLFSTGNMPPSVTTSPYMASRDFVILGTCAVEDSLDGERPGTVLSILDHYRTCPTISGYNNLTFHQFAKDFTCPKMTVNPKCRNKAVVVIIKPHYSPDPNSNNYDQYCQQKLMLHNHSEMSLN